MGKKKASQQVAIEAESIPAASSNYDCPKDAECDSIIPEQVTKEDNTENTDDIDDGRSFEDYTVVGEFEELVAAVQKFLKSMNKTSEGKETVIEFRDFPFHLTLVIPSEHKLEYIDGIDFFGFEEEVSRMFNIQEPFLKLSPKICNHDGADDADVVSVSGETGRMMLSALGLGVGGKDVRVFTAIGHPGSREWMGWRPASNTLYSSHPTPSLPQFSSAKCSAAISIRIPGPKVHPRGMGRVEWGDDGPSLKFPSTAVTCPVKEYLLTAVFPQLDTRCIQSGVDTLDAPILLLKGVFDPTQPDIITGSEYFLVQLEAQLSSIRTRLRNTATDRIDTEKYLDYIFAAEGMYEGFVRAMLAALYCPEPVKLIGSMSCIYWDWLACLRDMWESEDCLELPGTPEEPDWEDPLLLQKLAMLNYCMRRKNDPVNEHRAMGVGHEDGDGVGAGEMDKEDSDDAQHAEGRLECLKDINMQNYPEKEIYIPITQNGGCMTSDRVEAFLSSLQSIEKHSVDSAEYNTAARSALHSRQLSSDMCAFKAANPGATLVDFCQWYSPKDVQEGGQRVSERMRGGLWAELWGEAKAVPVSRQPALFNPRAEGEAALFYLEDLGVGQLVSFMLQRASSLLAIEAERETLRNALLVQEDNKVVLLAEDAKRNRLRGLLIQHAQHITLAQQEFVVDRQYVYISGDANRIVIAKQN